MLSWAYYQVESVDNLIDRSAAAPKVVAHAYGFAHHSELLHHALRANVSNLRRGPDAHEIKLPNRPFHRRVRRFRSEPTSPPRASDRVTDHRSPRGGINLEVDGADYLAFEHDGKRGRSLPWLGNIRRHECLSISPRERLRNVRQKSRELRVVAVGESVVDVVGSEGPKHEALGHQSRKRHGYAGYPLSAPSSVINIP